MKRRAFLTAAAALAAPFGGSEADAVVIYKTRALGPTMTHAEQMRWIKRQAKVASRLVPALRDLQAIGYRSNDGVTWTKGAEA